MKKILFLAFFMVAALSGCVKNDNEFSDDTPSCIINKIAEFKIKSTTCADANVKEYIFQNKFAYVFESGICNANFPVPVYNESCQLLGELRGATNNTKINNLDFYSNAKLTRTVWKK